MMKIFQRLSKSQKGATAVEYGLICSLIVVAALGAIVSVGQSANAMWNDVSTKVIDASN